MMLIVDRLVPRLYPPVHQLHYHALDWVALDGDCRQRVADLDHVLLLGCGLAAALLLYALDWNCQNLVGYRLIGALAIALVHAPRPQYPDGNLVGYRLNGALAIALVHAPRPHYPDGPAALVRCCPMIDLL